jgi:hypothetical protein
VRAIPTGWRGSLLLVVCSLVIAVTIGEVTLMLVESAAERRRSAQPTPFYMWTLYSTGGAKLSRGSGPLELVLDPVVTLRNRPNQIGPWFRINSRGYRGGELRADAGSRVVLVGGSTAFGTGMLSDADTFAAALERELGVEVVNCATIGFMAVQELALLQTELLDLRPQVVIALDGWNDLGIGRSSQIHGLLSEAFVQIEAMTIAGSHVNASFVAALGKTARRIFPRTRALLSPRPATGHGGAVYVAERAQLLARTHAAMAAACRARGCRLVSVLQPHQGEANQYDDFVRQTRAAHLQMGLEVLDASRVLSGGAENFLDDYHLTAAGNARLARAVAPIVRSALRAQEAGRE